MSVEFQLYAIETDVAGGLVAEHTYITAPGHNFNCFGRFEGGRPVRPASVSPLWACQVYGHENEGLMDSGLATGLSIRHNGVCQNVANRILVLADQEVDARGTKGNAFTILMYGKFGFNVHQYIEKVKSTGAQLLRTNPGEINPASIQVVLDRITRSLSPDAELDILHEDMEEQFNASLPDITDAQRAAFRPAYIQYQTDRNTVFAGISSRSQPTDQIAYGPLKAGLAGPWSNCVDRIVAGLGPDQFKMMFGVPPDLAKRALA